MEGNRIVMEVLKFVYGLLVAAMILLFFCLVLDVFCFVVGHGWNPLLGSWPIFSGTVASVIYGSWGTVLCLMLGVGAVARVVVWDRTPFLLSFFRQQEE